MISNVFADRGIKVKRIADLSHGSGKIGKYKALIIGINDYKNASIPDLETPINDAKDIAKVLKEKYGFKVKLLLDREATRAAIYRSLRRLAKTTKPNDSVLIYFAGHGDLDRTYDDGWWIPSDAEGGNPLTYLDNGQVQKAMRSMKARHVLLISDSCYSGTLFGKARSLPPVIDDKYYLSLYNEKSRWGMTSGNKTPVSDRGSGGHSVFAYQLIKELENNEKLFISTQELYTRIAPIISNNSEQTPLCRPIVNTSDQGGEFVFVASIKKKPPPTVPRGKQGTLDKEMLFWQSIQDSDSPALFEEYVEKFPNGFFASIARQKIEALKQKTVVASIPPEVSKSKLFMEVDPKDSRVRILNIKPRFQQGMELESGRYNVEVSKQGYETKKMWIKLEAGEEKKIKVRMEQLQASIRPTTTDTRLPSSTSEVIKRDGQYVAYANGVVKDTKTGLQWIAGPDRNTSFNEARSWVQSLNLDDGGWRMPTMDELETLYEKGKGNRNMTSLLKTTGWFVWSGGTKGSSRSWGFDFQNGSRMRTSRYRSTKAIGRAFAVRSNGESKNDELSIYSSPRTATVMQYDLTQEWSESSNPNGVWRYLVDGSLASSAKRKGDHWNTTQHIWGHEHTGWSKSNGTEAFSHDWRMGDVFVHTSEQSSVAINWISPEDGVVDILGGLWSGRDIGRSNNWSLTPALSRSLSLFPASEDFRC